MAWLKGLLSLCFLLANTILVCVPLFAMALLRMPLMGAWRSGLTRRMDGVIDLWVSSNRFLIRGLRLVDLEIHWPAEPLSRHNWYVVICNHQSWADILLLQHAFLAAIPPLKFFTKRELIWLPLAGPAMYVLGFPYVRRTNKAKLAANPGLKYADRDSTLAACAGFRNHPTSVLIFLEGTRFTDTKRNARNSRFPALIESPDGRSRLRAQRAHGRTSANDRRDHRLSQRSANLLGFPARQMQAGAHDHSGRDVERGHALSGTANPTGGPIAACGRPLAGEGRTASPHIAPRAAMIAEGAASGVRDRDRARKMD